MPSTATTFYRHLAPILLQGWLVLKRVGGRVVPRTGRCDEIPSNCIRSSILIFKSERFGFVVRMYIAVSGPSVHDAGFCVITILVSRTRTRTHCLRFRSVLLGQVDWVQSLRRQVRLSAFNRYYKFQTMFLETYSIAVWRKFGKPIARSPFRQV